MTHEQPTDELTGMIIGAAVEVHSILGPGLLESVYKESLIVEFKRRELRAQRECQVPLRYKGEIIDSQLRLDLLVEGKVVVEVKAVDRLHPIHQAQVITYLKLTGYPAGLLINFNSIVLKAGLKRLDHPDVYVRKAFS
jgi:GxxExxY protein